MGFNSSGYHSDDSQKPAVYRNMPFTEAAENDFGGPTLSARWIATHLLMTLTPVKCNPLISNLNALEDYVTDAIDPIDEVISWLRPSDQSILLALHFIERVTIKRNEVKEQRQDLFKRRQGIPPSLRALWRQLKPWCALNFDTTCGIEVALFLRRVLTLGIVLAEVMLNGRVPCNDVDRCVEAFRGKRSDMVQAILAWQGGLGGHLFVSAASFSNWLLALKRRYRLAHIVSPEVGFMDKKTAKAFDDVMEALPPPYKN